MPIEILELSAVFVNRLTATSNREEVSPESQVYTVRSRRPSALQRRPPESPPWPVNPPTAEPCELLTISSIV